MSTAQERFAGGTAVITGAGSGIGEGLARYAASIGMRVVVTDVDAERAATVADDIVAQGQQAEAQVLDVTDAEAFEKLAVDVYARYGSVELLINNAGLETAGVLWEIPVERWRHVMNVNVDGVFHGIRAFVPKMIEAGTPATVANMSSVGGVLTQALQTPYIVSKHAIVALTENLHQEVALAGAPIQVTVLLPYSVRSRIFVDAQAAAPSGNAAADKMFEVLHNLGETAGMDPIDAARNMFADIAAGEFWGFTDKDFGLGALGHRAETLRERRAPAPPMTF
ncbi:SDR family NAD(P)-dependent oxidoreductase [Nocardia farcinica]|uniref:SDR family NAD(P)-dependent oxidoreductase n=3 Tax=Nocardia TaxID=1817 RepID=UPI002457D5DE|nr:SDR family NAD(P)-dependent oxidoreductase [Nocardia farcinica]